MSDDAPRHHRHHKEHHVRRGKQIHSGGGPLHEEGEGLRLPQFLFNRHADYPFAIYPKGWTFNWLTPGRAAILVSGGSLALMVLCIALAKLLAG